MMKCTYVAAVPLRASKGPPQLLLSTDYSLNFLQHFMVIVNPGSTCITSPPDYSHDHQPQDPENILVAVAVLSGQKVPRAILVWKLSKIPKKKCWFVGYSKQINTGDAAQDFNEKRETDLRIGYHDCRHYCQGLVEYVTRENVVLEHLRESSYNKIL